MPCPALWAFVSAGRSNIARGSCRFGVTNDQVRQVFRGETLFIGGSHYGNDAEARRSANRTVRSACLRLADSVGTFVSRVRPVPENDRTETGANPPPIFLNFSRIFILRCSFVKLLCCLLNCSL